MERGGLSVAEFLPHNSAINSRFQSENWPIFENHAIKSPAHLGILRVRGGSPWDTAWHTGNRVFPAHMEAVSLPRWIGDCRMPSNHLIKYS